MMNSIFCMVQCCQFGSEICVENMKILHPMKKLILNKKYQFNFRNQNEKFNNLSKEQKNL